MSGKIRSALAGPGPTAISIALLAAALVLATNFPAGAAIAGKAIATLVLLALYFLSAIAAYRLKHPSAAAILILNFCIGWTLIGWAVLIIWAVAWRPRGASAPERQPCPHCAEAILPAAKVCRYCGSALRPGWAEGAEILTLSRRIP